MKPRAKRNALRAAALLFGTAPPTAAIFSYFPLWRERGSVALVSGFSLLLLLVAALPLLRTLREKFKSPSAPLVWLSIFAFFFIARQIANEVTVIAFVGFVGNCISAGLYALAKRYDDERSV